MLSSLLPFKSLSRRTVENTALYIIFVATYALWLNSVPNKLELFEGWVEGYLPHFKLTWHYFENDILSVKPNDSNQSLNAPFWVLLVQTSLWLFGKALFAYRLPDILLTALAPVLMAEIVRRFFRADLAFLAGFAVGAHQHVISFGRTGGYIGPTLTLLLAIILFGFSVAFENNRRSWIPLTMSLFLVPFFYSTIRYFCALGLIGIAWKFLQTKEFRQKHSIPLCAMAVVLISLGFAITKGGRLEQALIFISARGEQFLITEQTVKDGFEAETIKSEHRLSSLLSTMIPQRLSELSRFYNGGRRFFTHRYFVERFRLWKKTKFYLTIFATLGVASCLVLAIKQQRYLIILLWSILSWLPLLVTTGITPNRMLLGVPADTFILILGACAPLDLIARYLPSKVKPLAILPVWIAVLICGYHSIATYFNDYLQFPNL